MVVIELPPLRARLSGLVGRAFFGRGEDLDRAVFHPDRCPDASVEAVGGGLQLDELCALGEARMWVERGQHAIDRALDQRMVVDLVDVIFADLFEHAKEGFQLLLGVAFGRRHCRGRDRHHRQGANQRERWKQLGQA